MSIAVSDMARSLLFYRRALAPPGITQLMARGDDDVSIPSHVAFGTDFKPFYWIGDGEPVRGNIHVAFTAASPEVVDRFYAAAIEAGGRVNGKPGLRSEDHAGYYGAFVLDPDGCNIEAVHHDFSAYR